MKLAHGHSLLSFFFLGGNTHTQTIVENGLREARAIDTEALCIVAGEKAWSIHCEIHVLDDGGNIVDATCFATIAGIFKFFFFRYVFPFCDPKKLSSSFFSSSSSSSSSSSFYYICSRE